LQALEHLRAGNRRFAEHAHNPASGLLPDRICLENLIDGQHPKAIVLGCSDSRVPAEIVFQQGLGELFVIRVAGNVVAPSQIGSVEFAAEAYGTRLVVVMGHTGCGAVRATLDQLGQPKELRSRNLRSIVDRIRPGIETLIETDLANDPEQLMRYAVRANIRASTHLLRQGSEVLEELIRNDDLLIIGAEYSLVTGEVEFLEHPKTESDAAG
jgi:carbonic anhydrase